MTCPCESGRPFEQCCGPYLAGAPAPTAEALMRSRYTAYVRQDIDYLVATHDPDTAKDVDPAGMARWARESTWLGLQVLAVVGGGADDQQGEVEFVARFSGRSEEIMSISSLFSISSNLLTNSEYKACMLTVCG